MAKANVIDLEAVRRLQALNEPGLPDIVKELFTMFVNTTPAKIQKITDCARKNDLTNFRIETHGLKSASAGIGATDVSEICSRLEKLAESFSLPKADVLLKELNVAFEEAKNALSKVA